MSERIETFSYPDGTSVKVKYQAEILVAIKIAEGCWKKEGEFWTFYDEQNQRLDSLQGEMRVSVDGDIIAERKDGYIEIQYADGTFQIRQPDGRTETYYPAAVAAKAPAAPAAAKAPAAPAAPKAPAAAKAPAAPAAPKAPAAPAAAKAPAAPTSSGARSSLKTRDFRKLVSDSRIAELNGWDNNKDWKAVERTEDAIWYENGQGDRAKQDARSGSTTIYHSDGSWEQVDKNGKLKIRLTV